MIYQRAQPLTNRSQFANRRADALHILLLLSINILGRNVHWTNHECGPCSSEGTSEKYAVVKTTRAYFGSEITERFEFLGGPRYNSCRLTSCQ